ncbi:MAG: KamA family radical SAM protein [Candidatus Thorarchaeota archaeon]|nr:KamA family radical SAM protein [Candidatus Thorarchaeota archaeon]
MSWKKQLEEDVSKIDELVSVIDVNENEREILEDICSTHPLRISRYYLSLIDKNDKSDPIRRIAIPIVHERYLEGSYDTSGEHTNTVFQGLQHKYQQTAVILATNECAMYCRHCFRKRLVGIDTDETLQDLSRAVKYIKSHKEINNVLVTGGDPLVLPNDRIETFLKAFSEIEHLDFIRFGTRVPVTFPQRITEDRELLRILRDYSDRKQIYFVTQYNHPKEITEESTEAIKCILRTGITISNQTVLLKGVNDNPDVMAQLQRSLVEIGVVPYYIFQCRPVKRVKKHFQVRLYEGCKIIRKTRNKLDGHSKRFRFIMSHPTGKIEILGIQNEHFLFKYHQAKDSKNLGKIFSRRVSKTATWLDELEE